MTVGTRVLVFGGRTFGVVPAATPAVLLPAAILRADRQKNILWDALDTLHAAFVIGTVIEGEAPGADTLAKKWAEARGVAVDPYRADWRRLGRAAGPARNAEMLEKGRPQLALAAPGGSGTRDMTGKLRAAGVPTIGLRDDGTSEVLVPLGAEAA